MVRAEAVIDLGAISSNLARITEAAAGTPVMAVVKADGYGHGAVQVARRAREAGVAWLGVALPSEARALRESGDRGPLLAWLWAPGDEHLPSCIASRVDLAVSSAWALHEAEQAARRAGMTAHIHLKIDTGLSRNGASPADWSELLELAAAAQRQGRVEVTGIWSHLACADEPGHPSVNAQRLAFEAACQAASDVGLDVRWRHLANSAATLTRPDLHYDLVRAGIATYGVSPLQDREAASLGLQPAMTVRARVALVKALPVGAAVSYGATWQASRPTRVALVPMGYADGMPRAAGNRAWVGIHGARAPIVGRVAMDQFVIDVTDVAADVQPGDDIIVLGLQGPSADELAAAVDTIGYEIVTRMGPRLPRRYAGLA
ncbi:MAG: alanine racemase [Actinomycetales bacterium]|nr:alanine racemase [Actinomycetales bacterium]